MVLYFVFYIFQWGCSMLDNFDTNVASRKPNVSKKTRLVRPWDVAPSSVENDTHENTPSEKDEHKKFPSENNIDHGYISPEIKKNKSSTEKKITAVKRKDDVSQKSIALSDSINIHSNYCKLDNDISDYLFSRLSPSAQSVYLRLYRQSFGWNRNWAAESLPKLTKACNLSIQTVRKAIKELEILGCIKKDFSDYHKATVYRIFLPSEIGISNNSKSVYTMANFRGQHTDSLSTHLSVLPDKNLQQQKEVSQKSDSDKFLTEDLKNIEGKDIINRGQESNIQSIYFTGTSIYTLLESSGALPKNINKYMNNKNLLRAINIIDEFYDSIGFSIVSKALYRKSLIDYFELIKSGFSHDDIMYSVRWTFKNSRSRPESFSLIKHTMHLAMEDLINDLKNVSDDKNYIKEKKEKLKKNIEWKNMKKAGNFSNDDMKLWIQIVDDLKESLNEHSFAAFIEPLKLVEVEGDLVKLGSPSDSLSWVIDHYSERIEKLYREKTGKSIIIDVK